MTGIGSGDWPPITSMASTTARSSAWMRSVARRIGLRSHPSHRTATAIHRAHGPRSLITATNGPADP